MKFRPFLRIVDEVVVGAVFYGSVILVVLVLVGAVVNGATGRTAAFHKARVAECMNSGGVAQTDAYGFMVGCTYLPKDQ